MNFPQLKERNCTTLPLPCLLFFVCAVSLHAQNFNGFNYTSNGSSVTITGYTGGYGQVDIPAVINGEPVTTIGYEAFDGAQISGVTIPSSVTSIGYAAFANLLYVSSVTIPSSVTSIADNAFTSCYSLSSVTISPGVTSIGYEAFSFCPLLSITIPSSVTSIGYQAFDYCANLTQINVDPANPAYASVNGVLFDKALNELITYPIANTRTTYAIPTGVLYVDDFAFYDCSLSSVTIPTSVTSIGTYTFSGCVNLTSVSIPLNVNSIGDYAFSFSQHVTSAYGSGPRPLDSGSSKLS
jgi:hypothetical protein